jgi:uncharacterized protein (TIGR02996 family)
MPDGSTFLRAILENPDDDTARLVYADWLEEHGGEADAVRAEFIRVECELWKTEAHTPRYRKLEKRETALLKAHKKEWAAPFKGQALFLRFYRGFIEDLTVNAHTFCQRGARWFDEVPLRRVKMSNINPAAARPVSIAEVLEVPHIGRLRELDLERSAPGSEIARAVADCPALGGLRWLSLAFTEPDPEGLRRVLCSPHLAGVRSLDLSQSPTSRQGGVAELQRFLLTPREEYQLSPEQRGHLGDDGARRLAAAPNVAGLTELNLSGNSLSNDGVRSLADAEALRNLTTLRLDENWTVGDQGVADLARSPHLGELRVLSLKSCRVGDDALRALAGSPTLTRLRELNLSAAERFRLPFSSSRGTGAITDAGIVALASSPNMAGLRFLDLEGHRVTNAGAEAIAASPHLAGLGYLNLRDNPLDEARAILRKRFGPGVCTFSG